MNQTLLYALVGAAAGYVTSRYKTRRGKRALIGGVLGYAGATLAARSGIALPTLPQA